MNTITAVVCVEIQAYVTLSLKRWIGKHIPRANLSRYRWHDNELWVTGPLDECVQIKKTVRRLSRGKPRFTIARIWGSEEDLNVNNIVDYIYGPLGE